ncbi:uncharacterized protein LOC133889902 [Phragmites australis]|uniref:uncharacterized protein LOC133889902 n=1 Tax=Phragmites australis TaxID=29695 RepID=UPI002D771BA5|nr:uncharacterized protein LOC133889902 [Phragmites australis]
MGCCFSKKRRNRPAPGAAAFARRCEPEDRDPPSPEEEMVKEVFSVTPSAKPRAEPKPVANVVAVEEREVEKAKKQDSADAAVSDLGSCVSLSVATDERSEAASESSIATSSVAGPERSPGKPTRRRPVSADLGPVRRDRVAASYGVRSRSARASPSPPLRHVPRDRSVRRSPSPAAKRPSEQRRAASPVASVQRKPPLPARPSGRASPRRAQEAPPPISPPPSPPQPEDEAVTAEGELSIPDASAGGDGQGGCDGDVKESLENPLVSLECFIFL